jgi:hypothetical protein
VLGPIRTQIGPRFAQCRHALWGSEDWGRVNRRQPGVGRILQGAPLWAAARQHVRMAVSGKDANIGRRKPPHSEVEGLANSAKAVRIQAWRI